jgi:hypothetical protein
MIDCKAQLWQMDAVGGSMHAALARFTRSIRLGRS